MDDVAHPAGGRSRHRPLQVVFLPAYQLHSFHNLDVRQAPLQELKYPAQILHHLSDEVRVAEVSHMARRIAAWPSHKSEMWRDHKEGMFSAGVDQPLEVVDGADQGAVRRDYQLTSRVVPAFTPRAFGQGSHVAVTADTHEGGVVHTVQNNGSIGGHARQLFF